MRWFRKNNTLFVSVDLELGQKYDVYWINSRRKVKRCKFIQTTEHGYNLLNLDTHKCILKSHLYIAKKLQVDAKKNSLWFWVNSSLIIKERK